MSFSCVCGNPNSNNNIFSSVCLLCDRWSFQETCNYWYCQLFFNTYLCRINSYVSLDTPSELKRESSSLEWVGSNMHDASSMSIITQVSDRGTDSLKLKGNKLFNFFKMPNTNNHEFASIKDQGESGSGYTDPLQWTRREKYIWFFTLLAGTTACYSVRTTMPLVAPAISSDMKWSKTEVSYNCEQV